MTQKDITSPEFCFTFRDGRWIATDDMGATWRELTEAETVYVQTLRDDLQRQQIGRQIRPPMRASGDLANEPASILPGHITYALGPFTVLGDT